MQKGAKLDKPMADGRTSMVKAMEGNDMPMIDILLGADKNQNYADKNSFMYQMVELYQREDRGKPHDILTTYVKKFKVNLLSFLTLGGAETPSADLWHLGIRARDACIVHALNKSGSRASASEGLISQTSYQACQLTHFIPLNQWRN